jgi:hypothetical protein
VNRIVDHDPEEYADRRDEENTIHKRYLKAKHQASLKGHLDAKNQLFSND